MTEAKWFTAARKFPQLIGRTPDGGKLWGGPYTITQVAVGVVGIVVLWNTTWLWARFSFVGNLMVGPGLVIALVYGVGKLPFGMRNPLVVGAGWVKAAERLVSNPSPARVPRPHRTAGPVLMIAEDLSTAEPATPVVAPVETESLTQAGHPSSDPAPELALTGVQQLLLAARR